MSILKDRYFTRDCASCPFWDEGACSMVANCSTFSNQFLQGGKFYSALAVTKMVSIGGPLPSLLQNGHYIDRDGNLMDKIPDHGLDIAKDLALNKDIVGIFVLMIDK